MNQNEWSYNEFLAFLLIYIAHVDIEFSDPEKDLIQKRVGEEVYTKMLSVFNSMSDYQAYQQILDYKGLYYPTHDRKEELVDHMKALFHADHEFNVMERELLHFLEKMM